MRHPSAVLGWMCLTLAGCATPDATAPGDRSLRAVDRLDADATLAAAFPDVIALPTGFSPEGIAAGRGTTLFVGSIPTGSIWRGDARDGTGELLVPTQPGRFAVGLQYDQRGDRLFVAGAFTGQGYVYDATTGATLAVYQLAPADGFVNDVVVTRDAVYFTDSFRAAIYRLPLGNGGALPEASDVEEIPLTGDYQHVPNDFNANGIVATPGERALIIVNTATGTLYRVDPASGDATTIDLGGGAVPTGDGLVRVGLTLYVVQGFLNQVAVVRLSPDFTSGEIERVITDADFAIPSTVAAIGSSLYVVNARFDVAPPPAPAPGVEFQVVKVPR